MDGTKGYSGLVFWAIWLLLAISSLFYIGIWGYHNNNSKAIALTAIFGMILLFNVGTAITFLFYNKHKIIDMNESYGKSCMWFTLGFFAWVIMIGIIRVSRGGSFLYSVFSTFELPKQSLFAGIVAQLPLFGERFVNGILIPFVEEGFWLIALIITLVWIFKSLSKVDGLSFFENPILQSILIVIISSGSFALFHVGNTGLIAFIISALIFRTLLIALVWGDLAFDYFKFATILPSVALGIHVGNNLSSDGIMNFLIIMSETWYGWLIILLFAQFFVFGIITLLSPLLKSQNPLMVKS